MPKRAAEVERLRAVAVAALALTRTALPDTPPSRYELVSERALCALESALDVAGMGMTDEEVDAAP